MYIRDAFIVPRRLIMNSAASQRALHGNALPKTLIICPLGGMSLCCKRVKRVRMHVTWQGSLWRALLA